MDMKNFSLLADLYEFTMAASYFQHRMRAPATFSLFIRAYPPNRGYFVNAGLEDVLDFLEAYHFEPREIEYLDQTGLFSGDFLQFLLTLRFSGEVFAMPEGRIFFKDEPILEITAPIIEAQLVETLVINAVHLQAGIATKASRCVRAARGRKLVDFSLRRTQGIDAGLKVARASYIAGFGGTSNVLAGQLYGIPVSGTMAHSFVTSFDEEIDAFRAFAETFPDQTVLLIDTYDTLAGARKAAEVGREMKEKGRTLKGVRLDSGDMGELSRGVREILREAGFPEVSIFASGGFDEHKIARTLSGGGDIDAFGVGTKMGVSADAPYADMAYKLVQYDGRPTLKLSSGKRTLVGKKQVFRTRKGNLFDHDVIALRHETLPGEPLLEPAMEGGVRHRPKASLEEIRRRLEKDLEGLAEPYQALENPSEYAVELGPELERLQKETLQEIREKELGES